MHRLAVFVICLCLPSLLWGHGPAPSALTAFLDTTQTVQLIHTNIGLATPSEDGRYRYICPAQWAEEEYFPMPSILSDGRVAVVANGALYAGDSCQLEKTILEGWAGQAAGQSGDLVLERHSDGSTLWSLGGPTEMRLTLPGVRLDSLLVENSVAVLGASGQMVRLWTLPETGPAQALTLDNAPSGDYISIRMLDPVWFTLSGSGGIELYRRIEGAAQRVDVGTTSIHGPVQWSTGVAWLTDGELKIYVEGEVESLGQVSWRCLKRSGATIYACQDRDLVEVKPALNLREYVLSPLFELNRIKGVDSQCPPTDSPIYTDCLRQWFHFGAEAGLITDDTRVPEGESDGCNIGAAQPRSILMVLVLCIFSKTRRRSPTANALAGTK